MEGGSASCEGHHGSIASGVVEATSSSDAGPSSNKAASNSPRAFRASPSATAATCALTSFQESPGARAAAIVSLQNEFFLNGHQYPFSSRDSVAFGDGATYDGEGCDDANLNEGDGCLGSAQPYLFYFFLFFGFFKIFFHRI